MQEGGLRAFYKGITPRIIRVAPGQAVTFTVYEFLKEKLERPSFFPFFAQGSNGSSSTPASSTTSSS